MPAMDFHIRRAGHVVLRVTDPVRAREFLENVIGFQTFGQEGESFYFLTANPVSNHHMIAVRGGRVGQRLPDPRQIGMISIAYEVSSVDELQRLHDRIAEHGRAYGVTLGPLEDRGDARSFTCTDHDGNQLEFYAALGTTAAGRTARVPALRSGIRRTSHLTLRVRDLAASRAFYAELLHLVPIAETNGRTYLAGAPGGQPVLALEQAPPGDAPMPEPKKMFGMDHFSMEVASFTELQNAYRYLKGKGIDVHHTVDHGVTNSVYLIDPDGNLIEVYHDVPRAEYANIDSPFGSFGPIEDRLEEVSVS
jgi:catechol 2,3-dioxygenase